MQRCSDGNLFLKLQNGWSFSINCSLLTSRCSKILFKHQPSGKVQLEHLTPGSPQHLITASRSLPCINCTQSCWWHAASEPHVGPGLYDLQPCDLLEEPPPRLPFLSRLAGLPLSGLRSAIFPGKGPTGQAVRPKQGGIGSLRKTKTEMGGGKTLPSYITQPPWQGTEEGGG